MQRILSVQYSIPDYVHISPECRHLISRIFVGDPAKVSYYYSLYQSLFLDAKIVFPTCLDLHFWKGVCPAFSFNCKCSLVLFFESISI